MTKPKDMLERICATLPTEARALRAMSKASGISYDTLSRIAWLAPQGKYDPGYSKVKELYSFLFVRGQKR